MNLRLALAPKMVVRINGIIWNEYDDVTDLN